jgi:hypothetical protein
VPGGRAIAVAGLLLVAAVMLRATGCLAWELYRGRRGRRKHAALVTATRHPGPELGVAILDHDALPVYCLPCGRNQIVVSADALAALTPGQIRAVLARERPALAAIAALLFPAATACLPLIMAACDITTHP